MSLTEKPIESVLFEQNARNPVLKGIQTVHDAVACTLGPRGRNVIIERRGMLPHVTKDGVTVARALRLRDRAQALGAELMKEASSQTNDEAGDGTTTAAVLTSALCSDASVRLDSLGSKGSDLRNEMEAAVDEVISALKDIATPVKDGDITHVATISANGDVSIGELVARAMAEVGHEGVITLDEAKGTKTTLEIIDGLRLDRGYLSPYFVTDERRMSCVLENPYVLLTDITITSLRDITPILEQVIKQSRPILIIADDVTGEAMQGLVINTNKNVLRACAIRAPSFGNDRAEILGDLAALVGGEPLLKDTGKKLSTLTIDQIGSCRRVIIDKGSTTIVCSGVSDRVQDRVESVRMTLDNPTIAEDERTRANVRLANLQRGAAIIRVGGATEIEMKERKDRIEDALNSTRSAVEEGIVVGGGCALLLASKCLDDRNDNGAAIVRQACEAPIRMIMRNADMSEERIDTLLQHVCEAADTSIGINAMNEEICNMFDAGIIDPVKVTRCALKNALSVASMYVTLGCAVFDTDDALQHLMPA